MLLPHFILIEAQVSRIGHFYREKSFEITLLITCQWLPETNTVEFLFNKSAGSCKRICNIEIQSDIVFQVKNLSIILSSVLITTF